MPNQYNEDQKQLTTSSIRTSLLSIMEDKTFKTIKVSEVCKKAGVSRMAFYRHFKDLEEVLQIHLEEVFEAYIMDISDIDITNTYNTSLVMFNYIKKEQYFYTTMIKSGHIETLHQYIENFMMYLFQSMDFGYPVKDDDLKYYANYRAGGLVRLIVAWIRNGLMETAEEMAELATKFDFQ